MRRNLKASNKPKVNKTSQQNTVYLSCINIHALIASCWSYFENFSVLQGQFKIYTYTLVKTSNISVHGVWLKKYHIMKRKQLDVVERQKSQKVFKYLSFCLSEMYPF